MRFTTLSPDTGSEILFSLTTQLDAGGIAWMGQCARCSLCRTGVTRDVMAPISDQVIATVVAAAIIGACAWLWRRLRASAVARQRVSEAVAYTRSGFRLQAVLDVNHESDTARAVIGRRAPAVPINSQVKRVQTLASHPFQRRKSFAAQVYATWVPWCASHGWGEIVISGWNPISSANVAWAKEWTLRFKEGNLVLGPGWSPVDIIIPRDDVYLRSVSVKPKRSDDI